MDTAPSQETPVWSDTPAQRSHLLLFTGCGLLAAALAGWASRVDQAPAARRIALLLLAVPFLTALGCWIQTRCRCYTLTSQRLIMRAGVWSQVFDDLELYRVKDLHMTRTLFQRWLGIGTIVLRTTDVSTPMVILPGMIAPQDLLATLRVLVETRRDAKGVREVDINSEHLAG